MKLSKREKYLLSVLALILFLFGYYNFVLKKQIAKINALKEQETTLEAKTASIKNQNKAYKAKEEEYKILNSKILSKSEKLFPVIMQEKIIVNLDTLLKDSKLDGYSIKFTEPKLQSLQETPKENKESEQDPLKALAGQYNSGSNTSTDKKQSEKSESKNSKVTSTAEKILIKK